MSSILEKHWTDIFLFTLVEVVAGDQSGKTQMSQSDILRPLGGRGNVQKQKSKDLLSSLFIEEAKHDSHVAKVLVKLVGLLDLEAKTLTEIKVKLLLHANNRLRILSKQRLGCWPQDCITSCQAAPHLLTTTSLDEVDLGYKDQALLSEQQVHKIFFTPIVGSDPQKLFSVVKKIFAELSATACVQATSFWLDLIEGVSTKVFEPNRTAEKNHSAWEKDYPNFCPRLHV
ncbi:unnamed protein product [Protopolystoma xenopodis]|uniref:Uncharacterized protein n=1 Tax=Protopolystoma xenopodis TaxID=117903 RepID=A0A3S5B9D0_9PLAT|nr:unnamed protein product [Protopolystoma xenopodis]